MPIDRDREILRLRTALRDLVALFSIPAVWVDREPAAVVEGLMDALAGLSQIDFAFVRLSDVASAFVADATRGEAWSDFEEWLEHHLLTSSQPLRREVVPDVGAGGDSCRGLVLPVGVDAEAGLVAVASRQVDFPTETDLLLLSMAANHAATAFQNACLILERRKAEDDLRRVRDGLARELAAVRKVAALVAGESSPQQLLAAVAEQVARIIDVPLVRLVRYEPDGSAVELIGGWGKSVDPLAIGARWRLDGPGVLASVWERGRPARVDDYSNLEGQPAAVVRQAGMRSAVASPMHVEGRLWGAIAVFTPREESLPADTEGRLADFTELVATAIASAEAHKELIATANTTRESREALAVSEARARELANEQAALRRVATVAARESSPVEVLEAVAEEAARVLEVDAIGLIRFEPDGTATLVAQSDTPWDPPPLGTSFTLDGENVVTSVYRTQRVARLDDWENATGSVSALATVLGIRSAVAFPIVVGGRLWGTMIAATNGSKPLPADTGSRLSEFTELLATAISNAESREALTRRGAALAASEARKSAILESALDCIITIDEEGKILEFNPAAEKTFGHRREAVIGRGISDIVIPPALREQHYRGFKRYLETGEGPILRRRVELTALRSDGTEFPVELAITPIDVADHPMFTAYIRDITDRKHSEEERARLLQGERAARADAEAASRRARALAKEQAALRRVATLVARGGAAEEVFSAVAREVGRVLGVQLVTVDRYESDGTSVSSVVLASLGDPTFPVGSRWPLDGPSIRASIYETGRPARLRDWTDLEGTVAAAVRSQGMRWAIGVPIVVEGSVWGNIIAGTSGGEPIPVGGEERLARFTELVSTSVTNTTMRVELAASEARARGLADEQAALRRVATLVARGASPDELFTAVAEEVAGVIDVPVVVIGRYEADRTFTLLGLAGETDLIVGSRWPVQDEGIGAMILSSGHPSRKDDYSTTPGRLGELVREELVLSSTVGVPITVEGQIWGFMVAAAKNDKPIPAHTESELARFTELIATAVSNATTRADLLSSRARLVNAADETRRRLERDLHDGIQQGLVTLALRARQAAQRSAKGESTAAELSRVADDLVLVTDELREISHGIHPAILSDAGLDDALAALARRSAIRVDLDVGFRRRFDPTLEATVYYVVAESITNAVKHAQTSTVSVRGGVRGDAIEFEIQDDGIGGADPRRGTGLIGLKDRIDTLGGTISVASPPGAGTTISVTLPASPHHVELPPR